MNLLDTLQPRKVEIKGARLVSRTTDRDDPEDKPYPVPTFRSYLTKKTTQKAIRDLKLRRLKDRVKKAKKVLARAEKDLKEFLCVNTSGHL